MKMFIALIATFALTAPAAFAQGVLFTGNTTGGPTFARPLSLTATSSNGTAVPTQATTFTVSVTGNYNLSLTQTADVNYDTYLHVYQNSFSPTSSLTNLLYLDDDSGPGSNSALASVLLSANTTYIFVADGFDNADFGQYAATIGDVTRPAGSVVSLTGAVTVPEAGTGLLALAVLPILGVIRRRVAK